jgi:outer membrane autotransporter protein
VVFNASFAYGQSDSTVSRNLNVAGGGASTARAEGSEWTGQVGVALPLRSKDGSTVLTPSVHLLHANVSQDAFTQSSLGGLEARVNSSSTKSTAVRTGVQAAKLTKLASKPTRLTASLDWVHSFDSNAADVDIALTGAGSTTARFSGSKSSQDTIRFGLGGEVAVTERVRVRLNVDERFQGGVNSTFGSASVGFQF